MSEAYNTIETNNGKIKITDNALATIVGKATIGAYGVVGMASRNELHDGLNQILNRQNYSKGIQLSKDKQDCLNVNIYVVIQYGTKLSEVAKDIQNSVAYELKAMLGLTNERINVIIQGIRVSSKKSKHSKHSNK